MIGLYGGTFDPVHYGHLRTGLEARELFGLDTLRFVPCGQPPHRPPPVASAWQRARMLRLAVAGRPGLAVDTRELERPGPSYTVDTLASLRAEFPAQSLLLFIGADAFNHLPAWHRWQRLFDYAHVVVMARPGFRPRPPEPFLAGRLAADAAELAQTPAGRLHVRTLAQLDISATTIRQLFAQHRDPGFLLPDAVIAFIRGQRLYGS